MASKYIKKFKVPNHFEDILSDFAKEILRNQPKDIIDFGIEYFKGLETNTKFDYKDKGENRPENYKRPENQEPNIINAPNKLEISQEDKGRLQRSMDKIERINKDPVPVPEEYKKEKEAEEYKKEEEVKHEEIQEKKDDETQNKLEYGRHISKYEEVVEGNYQKSEVREEVTVTKQVTVVTKQTVIKNGEVVKNETTVQKYSSGGENENGQNALPEEEPVKEGPPEEVPVKEGPPKEEPQAQRKGRYGNVNENEEHKKEYDDWFTKHSIDKQVIDYKPEKEEEDTEALKRNEVGYNTWFLNHSVKSLDHNQSGDVQNAGEEGGEHKGDYGDWFNRHSGDKLVIDYKPEKEEMGEVIRNEGDYATWFENHSKMTNKQN